MGQALVTDLDLQTQNSDQVTLDSSDSGLSETLSSDASTDVRNSRPLIVTDLTEPMIRLVEFKSLQESSLKSEDKIAAQPASCSSNSTVEVCANSERTSSEISSVPDVSLSVEFLKEVKNETEEKVKENVEEKNDDGNSKVKEDEEKEITEDVARTILQLLESVVAKKTVTIVEEPKEVIRFKPKPKERPSKEILKPGKLALSNSYQKTSMTLSSRSNVNVKGKQEKLARRVDAESEMSRLQKQVSTILSLELNKTTKLDDKSASAEEEQRVPCLADYHKDEVGHRTRERFCSQCSSRVKLLEEQKRGLSLKLMESEKNVERLVRVLSNLKDILRVVIGEIQANTQQH